MDRDWRPSAKIGLSRSTVSPSDRSSALTYFSLIVLFKFVDLSGSESSHEVHARSEIEEVDCVLLPYPSEASQSDLEFRWSHFSLFLLKTWRVLLARKKSDKMNKTGGKSTGL